MQALVKFLQEGKVKVVNIDTWTNLLNFVQRVGAPPKFENYKEEDAWPVLIDEYVDHAREAAEAQNGS